MNSVSLTDGLQHYKNFAELIKLSNLPPAPVLEKNLENIKEGLITETPKSPLSFDSYILHDLIEDKAIALKDNKVFRLLEVDNNLLLPSKQHFRFLITSVDVLHS